MRKDVTVIELTSTRLRFLDQTRLPGREVMIETTDYRDVVDAIRRLRLRGAPLIGIAAAYGVVVAARAWLRRHPEIAGNPAAPFREEMLAVCDVFAGTRPTAVNLFWALARIREILGYPLTPGLLTEALENEAQEIHDDDARRCTAIGKSGAACVPAGAGVITHCNTGTLATGGEGTAFAVLLEAHRQGKGIHVYADETRPLLQGARLTMWELQRHGIPSTLIADGAAAMLMQQGRIQLAITGADRIAANGDAANKIGTYGLAVAAKHHGIPFYIAAPLSTVDLTLASGAEIPIEERGSRELTHIGTRRLAPEGAAVFNPAFDVTPAGLIAGIITERGIIAPPYRETLAALHP